MKRILTLVMALAVVSIFTAAQAQEFICEAKAGTAYASDPAKFGFNSAIEAGVGINPYFELLAMPGFTWFNWDQGLGVQKYVGPGLSSELKTTVNGYMFPVLAGAKFKVADLKESIGIVPYVTLGAGYTWLNYSYSTPSYNASSTVSVPKTSGSSLYKGFTWMAIAGVSYTLGDTGMSVLAEGGYRGCKLDKGSYSVDMSGFVANVGVSFSIGGSNP